MAKSGQPLKNTKMISQTYYSQPKIENHSKAKQHSIPLNQKVTLSEFRVEINRAKRNNIFNSQKLGEPVCPHSNEK